MANTENMSIGAMGAKFRALADAFNGSDKRAARVSVVAAGNVLKGIAKRLLVSKGLVRTGAYLKNIVIKRETQAPDGTVQYNLGVRHGRDLTKKQKAVSRLGVKGGRIVKQYVDDPFYWRFQEFGHKTRPVTGGGKKVGISAKRKMSAGFVAPVPVLGPALDTGRGQAIDAMSAALDKEIAKVATAQ